MRCFRILVLITLCNVLAVACTTKPKDNSESECNDAYCDSISYDPEPWSNDNDDYTEESQWEFGNYTDEFGEYDQNRPYASTSVNGYIYFGESDRENDARLYIDIAPEYGIRLSISATGAHSLPEDSQILLKNMSSGEVINIPFEADGYKLYITSPNAIEQMVSALESGNYKLSITSITIMDRYYKVIVSELRAPGARQAFNKILNR